MPPCVLFEDEHLLVVNKPAGWNTHAPAPFAGEGIYDWLKHREPRWASLAIIHRLDKETSGVMVFGKTALANRSLTEQFTARAMRKKYLLLTDRPVKQRELTVKSKLLRAGERYVSGTDGELAETRFHIRNPQSAIRDPNELPPGGYYAVMAEPLTGRTHQIRVHAAESGFPILGDTLYGGTPFQRVCLHAAELSFNHPATNEAVAFSASADFAADRRLTLRAALLERRTPVRREIGEASNRADLEIGAPPDAFRLIHGASDSWPGWYVERLGEFLLSQSERDLNDDQRAWLTQIGAPNSDAARTATSQRAESEFGAPIRGVYHKVLSRHVRGAATAATSPQLVIGAAAPDRFAIRENGVKFDLSFNEGYSVGLFLDQRDNRRRLLVGHVAADFSLARLPLPNPQPPFAQRQSPTTDNQSAIRNPQSEILNTFAYTCGFSVCAALAGARTTSLDLSKKYLEWGKRNFALNGLDPAAHDFIYGDTFDWLKRLARKQRLFDVVILDPPTFSQSKEGGVFRAEKDYGRLVRAALPVLRPGGVLFASTNAAEWKPEDFLADVERAILAAGRKIVQRHYVSQPPDFPVSRAEPAYLKTVWMRVAG